MQNKTRRYKLALAWANRRALRQGNQDLADQIDAIRSDPDILDLAAISLEEESSGGLLRDILNWIVEHPDEFKALIEWLISLFSTLENE